MTRHVAAWFALVLAVAATASAQQRFETVGERALGMAGAFVAVADDATAVHWNPAGLATGAKAGMTIGWYRSEFGNQNQPVTAGPLQRNGGFTSLGTLPLGISYGRFDSYGLVATADGVTIGQIFRLNQYAVTLVQSVMEGLVVGGTVKYLRGQLMTAPAGSGSVSDAFDRLKDVDGERTGAFDADLGVMATSPHIRIGLTVKNLATPTFGDPATFAMTLQLQPRLGLAFLPNTGLTLAMDLDLDTVDLRGDLRRILAIGGEAHLGSRVAVRSGVRWNLEGTRHPVGAAGLSLRIRSGFWLDGHYALGRVDEDREYGVAMRAGF